MKKLKLIISVIMFAVCFSSCISNDENIFSEPREIPLLDYSLYETCVWNHEGLRTENMVFIVNDNKTLQKHLSCSVVSYPNVDFSKNTLLFAKGLPQCCNPSNLEAFFFQNGKNEFTLQVNYKLGIFGPYPWTIAFLIPRISDKANIKLKITEL